MIKTILFPLGALVLAALSGCATADEAEAAVTNKLEEGLSGRGRLVSPDPMGDRFGSYYD
ncbi:MAG: hypothetical protein FGM15_04415 [Chthoniobacterales bacterium]|nr:hypothetical protein [Chthoniobacterales bacterium]